MEEFLNQIKGAISCKLYYPALFMTVAIPDICSALQSQNNDSDSKKYKEWFNKYITKLQSNKYGESGQLKADHLWNIRCSLFHQGVTSDKKDYKRMLFIEPGNPTYSIHCCVVGANTDEKSLLIDIVQFCDDMIKGAEQWLKDKKGDQFYKQNYDKLIKRYPKGIVPVFGTPVIG